MSTDKIYCYSPECSADENCPAADCEIKSIPRCGDHVLHKPSDETWVVAWCEGDDLAWCGWPNGMARTSDCEIVRVATDDEHKDWVKRVVLCGDSRAIRAIRLYVTEHQT